MQAQSSAGVLQGTGSEVGALKHFCKIHRKTSAPESFNEVVERRSQAYYFIKIETVVLLEICKIFKKPFVTEQLWTTASDISE